MDGVTVILKCKDDPHVLEAIRSIDCEAEIVVALVRNERLRAAIEARGAVRVVEAPDDNVGASCQIGLEAARHERCILSDSDTLFHPGYIMACVRALREVDLCRGAIGFRRAAGIDGSGTVARVRHFFNNVLQSPYMPGLGLNRSFALALGGFDTEIRWGVDHEFAERALAAGARYRFLSEVSVEHLPITAAHDLRAAARTGRALGLQHRRQATRFWRGRRITCHLHEPYLRLFRHAGLSGCRHHMAWVRAFHAGYWAVIDDADPPPP